jgi:predicted ATPase
MSTYDDFVVITGGPGAGKSTLIAELRRSGFGCVEEAGRAIIRDQRAIGGHALHQAAPLLFAEVMLAWEMRSYRQAARWDGPVFFDRAIPDIAGYHGLLGRPVPPHVSAAVELFRYHRRVFIAPPWPEIYTNDSERGQDFDEAVRTHDAIAAAYTRHGYELIPLPKAEVSVRVAFIDDHLAGCRGSSGPDRPGRTPP